MITLIDIVENAVKKIQDKTKMPEFRIGDILEVDSELTRLNRSFSTQFKMYPFIYMQTNYLQKSIKKFDIYEASFNIYIVNKANADLTEKERRKKERPELDVLKLKLLRALEIEGIEFEDYEDKIEYYKSEENEFSVPINIESIRFAAAQYCLI